MGQARLEGDLQRGSTAARSGERRRRTRGQGGRARRAPRPPRSRERSAPPRPPRARGAKGRVRRQYGTVGKDVRPAEAYERPTHTRQVDPSLNKADSGDVRDPMRRGSIPFEPRSTCGNARLEDKPPSGSQRVVNTLQAGIPVIVIDDRLGDVSGHRRKVDLKRRQPCRVAINPADACSARLCARATSSDAGIDRRHQVAALGQQQRGRSRAATNVQHTSRIELGSNSGVDVSSPRSGSSAS